MYQIFTTTLGASVKAVASLMIFKLISDLVVRKLHRRSWPKTASHCSVNILLVSVRKVAISFE